MVISAQAAGSVRGPIYTVSQLNEESRLLLENHFALVWVEGELSNLSKPSSGHLYFSLKDKNAQIRCALFRSQQNRLDFNLEEGMGVLVRAKVSLYQQRGDFQLIVETIQAAGDGALQRAFMQLKKKLAQAGLFDAAHKKAVPKLVQSIGVITSPTGAAVRDILATLKRRFPLISVVIYPSDVQGKQAANQIAAAIALADRRQDCEVLILARGGGALEDLWAFNEEIVARAIYACRLPLVTGIGHEIDFTIADFVADWRGATPTAAAEYVSPNQGDYFDYFSKSKQGLIEVMTQSIKRRARDLVHYHHRLRHPSVAIGGYIQRIDHYEQTIVDRFKYLLQLKMNQLGAVSGALQRWNPQQRFNDSYKLLRWEQACLKKAIQAQLKAHSETVARCTTALEALNPLATLARGYAIATNQHGEIIYRSHQLSVKEHLKVQFHQGCVVCEVKTVK